MNTYPTLDEIRETIKTKGLVGQATILEIDHTTEGRCYIGVKVSRREYEAHMAAHAAGGVRRIVAEHSALTAAEAAQAAAELDAQIARGLRAATRCERCGDYVDGNTAYSQREGSHGILTHYCATCARVLGAVGGGEYTAMQARAVDVDRPERETK